MKKKQDPNTNTTSPIENVKSTCTLPLEFGKSPPLRLTNFYARILEKKIGTRPTINYGLAVKTFNSLLAEMEEIQVALIIMAHCNYSSRKDDGWLEKQLKQRVWPLTFIINNCNVYKTYLIYEKMIEFDDLDTAKEVVSNYINRLTN